MERKHRELLQLNKEQFYASLDVQLLLPFVSGVLGPTDLAAVQQCAPGPPQVECLLDRLPSHGAQAFHAFCVGLETHYPQLLTAMFLGSNQDNQSLTSESDDEGTQTSSNSSSDDEDDDEDLDTGPGYSSAPSSRDSTGPGYTSAGDSSGPGYQSPPVSAGQPYTSPPLTRDTTSQGYTSPPSSRDSGSGTSGERLLLDLPALRQDPAPMPDTCDTRKPPSGGVHHEVQHAGPSMMEARRMESTGHQEVGPLEVSRLEGSRGSVGSSGSGRALEKHSSRDYDWLKSQCERAMKELQSLKRQHGDTVRRCDQAVREADMYRQKYILTKGKMEQMTGEIRSLKGKQRDLAASKAQLQSDLAELAVARAKEDEDLEEAQNLKLQYHQLLAANRRLESELAELTARRADDKREIDELRQQQRDVISESGSSEVLNRVYSNAFDKYDAIKSEYEDLRERHSQLTANHSSIVSKKEALQEEVAMAKRAQEKALEEKMLLQQQCTSAIKKWSSAICAKDEQEKELRRVRQERDELKKGLGSAMSDTLKSNKDFGRLRLERDAMFQEYSLVMSERNSVLKEIEQLQDKLSDTEKKVGGKDKELKNATDEVETLRCEIKSALRDRDHAIKVMNELKQSGARDSDGHGSADMEHNALEHRDHYRVAGQHTHSFEQLLSGSPGSKELLSKETEGLRKELEKLQTELSDSIQEAEVSKRRRDWAFNERDKIVQERESIRLLCDKLRRERDRAVSDLAEALRDLDQLKKQKDDATKELKDVKERLELQMEKEARKNQLNSVGHNNSHDSAIDADLQEWELEKVWLELSGIQHLDDLGFDLVGGKDDPQLPNDNSIYVSNVCKGSCADGKLKVNDLIVSVNNVDMTNTDKAQVMQVARSGGKHVNMVVRRRKSASSKPALPVTISMIGCRELGISLEQGLFISRIYPGSAAAREGSLGIGDRIVQVNGRSVENLSANEVLRLAEGCGDMVVLNVRKYCATPQPSLGSSTASSGHNLLQDGLGSPHSPPVSQTWLCSSPDSSKVSATYQLPPPRGMDSPQGHGMENSTGNSHLLEAAADEKIFRDQVYNPKVSAQTIHGDRHLERMIREGMKEREKRENREREENRSNNNHGNSRTMEEEVIDELNAIISHYTKTPGGSGGKGKLAPGGVRVMGGSGKSKDSKRRAHKQQENAGTWPKCHSQVVNLQAPAIQPLPKRKSRPPLTAMDGAYPHSPTSPGPKVPPTPPERSDSFKRGAQRKPVHLKDKGSLDSNSKQHYPSSHPPLLSEKSGLDPPPELPYSPQPHYPSKPSGDTGYPLDNTVVSAQAQTDPQELLNSMRGRSRPARPTSAPSRGRALQRELAQSSHRHGDPVPHKPPSSLDIQPMYSPRPLPHSAGQAIPPATSTPVSPRDKLHQNFPSTAPHSHSHHRALHHYPNSGSGHTSRHGGFQAISSHRMSPAGVPGAPPSLASPRYSSPPGYSHSHGRSGPPKRLNSSIPEVGGADHSSHRTYGERYSTPSPSPSQQSSTFEQPLTLSNEDFPYHRMMPRTHWRPPPELPSDGCSTFPHRRGHNMERIHIPSNPSVVSSRSSVGKVSTTSSVERMSERSSPISPFPPPSFDYMAAPKMTHNMSAMGHSSASRRPQVGETRSIKVEKSQEPLGITIEKGSEGGIFVSSVSDNSLAAQQGIQIGDQLLEVCGINMRNATYQLAANVLRQCGNSVTMLVQYNPEKYLEDDSSSSHSSPETSATTTPETGRTPLPQHMHAHMGSDVSTLTPDSPQSRSPSHSIKPPPGPQEDPSYGMFCEPRFVFLKKSNATDNLGIGLLGGNAVGIFVRDLQANGAAAGPNGLRCGDQILEFNGINLRSATAEQAWLEITKPAETVSIMAQYNSNKYNQIQDQAGDSLYLRALVDREATSEEELSFRKDAILYIDDTLYNGMLGVWRAWLLDDEGKKVRCGTMPSKARLEDELVQKRSISDIPDDELKGSRRGSGSARRSFFRRKKHQRNNSKDSRELNSYSDVSINSDSANLIFDGSLVPFQQVDRLECHVCRPVLIIGALAEPLINKLTSESPDKYCRCEPEPVQASLASIEAGMDNGVFVDFKRRDSHYECITVMAVRNVIDKNRHCLLNVGPSGVEALHKVQIYPIVLFLRHKSPKQIREVRDTRFLPEKLSNKVAKELYETYQKYDQEHRHLFSEVIPGGNLAFMCFKIKAAIDNQQKKTVWIRTSSVKTVI